MKVIQYTNTSQETFTEEVTVLVPTVKEIEVTKMVMKHTYQVELTQEQVDVIVAICGNVIGGGPTRRLTDGIWSGLQDYASKTEDGCRKYSFGHFFKVDASSRYLITKEDYND